MICGVFLSGCASTTSVERRAPHLVVTPAQASTTPVVPTVTSGLRYVKVEGQFALPDQCMTVSARDKIVDTTLVIHISEVAATTACPQAVAYVNYTVVSLDVPHSVRHLKVIEDRISSSILATVVDTSVIVPAQIQ